MKTIQLTKGLQTFVDDADFEWLSQWKWCSMTSRDKFYGARNIHQREGSPHLVLLHRQILGLEKGDGLTGDHINGNTLDNRRENLRIATYMENGRNRGKQANNTSGFKGVSWHKRNRKWWAQIQVDGKHFSLGFFTTPEKAHAIYCEAATKQHREFARHN